MSVCDSEIEDNHGADAPRSPVLPGMDTRLCPVNHFGAEIGRAKLLRSRKKGKTFDLWRLGRCLALPKPIHRR